VLIKQSNIVSYKLAFTGVARNIDWGGGRGGGEIEKFCDVIFVFCDVFGDVIIDF